MCQIHRTHRPEMPLPFEETVQMLAETLYNYDRNLLGTYLIARPDRVREALRQVPDLVRLGMRAKWSLKHGDLKLLRIELEMGDPFTEMLLWHALFPVDAPPLEPHWLNGRLELTRDLGMMDKEWLPLKLKHGVVQQQGEWGKKHTPVLQRDPLEFPLYLKLLLLPLILLLTPFVLCGILVHDIKAHRYGGWWSFLLIPLIAIVFFARFFFPRLVKQVPFAIADRLNAHRDLADKLDRVG